MIPPSPPLIILGGRSLVAPYLMQRLGSMGLMGAVVSRRAMSWPEGFRALQLDLAETKDWKAPSQSVVISLMPIWVLAEHADCFANAQALIAVSSTSRFGKAGSADPKERATAEKLERAEDKLREWCERHAIALTILRPTLIYDGEQDQNVTRMARVMRRFGVFPVAAPAKGLRQPIHADDVAGAIIGALGNPAARGKALNIAGAEVLTYRQMAERVFLAVGRKPRLLMLPTWLLQAGFRAASNIGFLREKAFGFAVFQRMNEDLVFDVDEGLRLLDYKPRGFKPQFCNNRRSNSTSSRKVLS